MKGTWCRVQGDIILGALIIANTILGIPDYNYGVMGPKTLF